MAKTKVILLEQTIKEFARASDLIDTVGDYAFKFGAEESRNIGAHFRHNIDFARNFLSGMLAGQIDYSERERDRSVEKNRLLTKLKIEKLIEDLRKLSISELNRSILVRWEIDETLWHRSSGMRELEFLYSHTVHHHAMIAEKLRGFGIESPSDFGVSYSTISFLKKENDQKTIETINISETRTSPQAVR